MHPPLDDLATRQHGILSYEDLLDLGLSPRAISRRTQTGSLFRVHPRVYRVTGAPSTWQQRLWAAKKWAGDDGVFSHRSGLLLQRLAGATDHVVEMTVTKKMRSPDPYLLLHWSKHDAIATAERCHGLPVTSIARTIMDAAAVTRPWNVEVALDDALRHNLVTVEEMWEELERFRRGRKGSKLVRRLLEQRSDGRARSHSNLEIKLDHLLAGSDVPKYFRQFVVMTRLGIPADIDFAWPEVKLGVEADGYKWHSGRRQWQSDMARQNALAEVGWLILRFSWDDITRRPDYVIETILATYAARLAAK
jgi:very-short-patch-repair endonuclease